MPNYITETDIIWLSTGLMGQFQNYGQTFYDK